ncbi:cytochrome P450 [Ktedonospora formicarum]|uniref:Putative cytochrome P450 YjiB n=1 Tax=Ktedonospora formicarum TaxID=2778364 RepID=A0A8J3I6Y1_9CHLR|nr:cytochrome P450 [Ktedonospora formicarum]GHO45834.1 putative cytochrome P450 YjiB [Ktedonospora formicarum]
MKSLTEYTLPPLEWHRQARAWYLEMLEDQPVYFDETNKCWWVFRYDDVAHVLKDYETFSSARLMNGAQSESIITLDPPRHRQLRTLVTQAFSARAIAAMEPRITRIVNDLLAQVKPAGKMDVMEDLAYPLPVIVIAEMLGLPREDWPKLKAWSDLILGDFTQEQGNAELADEKWVPQEIMQEMYTYFFQALQARRIEPRDDLMTQLLQSEVDGQSLDDQELFSFCITLLVAGNVTTTNLIGNAILCFNNFPEAMEHLRAEPELMPRAIEEVLRYLPPIRKPGESDSVIIGRTVTTETMLGEKTLRKGETVMVGLASANFDRRQFPNPERFDITRDPNRHLSFGHGVHFCLGAPLSRLEARIALNAMLQQLSDLRVDSDATLEQVRSGVVFGVKNLPITFTPS